ncbi:MAG: hypothetical protein IIW21_01955 [Clostridia bacterium]|nr:hypothetical protein [Clostridia bacterium]
MDKNENGTPSQFSPEELIRRLKSQLNINTEQDTVKNDDNDIKEDVSVIDDVIDNDEILVDEDALEVDEEAAAVIEELVQDEVEVVAEQDSDESDESFEIVTEDAEAEDDFAAVIEDSSSVIDEDASPAASSTVEFSISDLFGNSDSDKDSAKEIELPEEKPSESDELDFLSFLTASGIAASKNNDVSDDPDDLALNEFADIDTVTEIVVDDDAEENAVVDELPVADEPIAYEQIADEVADEQLADSFDQIPAEPEIIEPVAESIAEEEPAIATENAVAEVEEIDNEIDYTFDDDASNVSDSDENKALPDFNMLIALGIPVAEVEKIYGADAADEYQRLTEGSDVLDDLSEDEEEYEYTSRAQNEEVEQHHKSEKKLTFVKLVAAAVLFIFAFLFENLPALGAEYSGWMDQTSFPIVHIMVDLQLVLFAAVLAWDELVLGIKALLKRTATVGSVLAVAVVINVLCSIALCFTRVAKYEVKLAGAAIIFAIFMSIGISALRLFAESKAFALISQKGIRSCVLTESPDDVSERNAFFDKISKDEASSAKVLSFGKTKFVSGFFRNQTSDRATIVDKIIAPAALVGAIIAFVISYAVSKSVGIALYTFNCASVFLVPVSVFAAGTITYARAASYADSMKAAIIGENAPYDIADSSVVAFEDRDAYPSYCVKLRNLKVYGNIAIVDVLRMTTTAFRQIGGPLSDVLESATSELNKDVPVTIVKSCESGIEAEYEGQRLLIGKADFLHAYGIIPYSDVDDREYLKTGDVSIMYVAYGDELSAKFYIQYTLDVDFEVLLRDLNRSGICVSIRTSDPNIDKRLLQAKLNLNKTSLRIVYRNPLEDRSVPTEETDSAVVGTGTPSELIHTAMLCDRVVHVYRTNTIVKALSLTLGLALLVLFALISVNVNVFSGLLIIYQLFWMIPTLVVSKLFL